LAPVIATGAIYFQLRAPHIHFLVRTGTTGTLTNRVTSQLFFDPTPINTIYTTAAACSARGAADTSNAADMVYDTITSSRQIAGPQLLVTLVSNGSGGYTATFNVYVQAA
jgi:hypothetical protein